MSIDGMVNRSYNIVITYRQKYSKHTVKTKGDFNMIYGYARVSTAGQKHDGNSLESQRDELIKAGAQEVFEEAYTGTKTDRPILNSLINKLKSGDTLTVVKLDRLSRTAGEGANLIKRLTDNGIKVNIINMGIADTTSSMGKLMVTILLAFAEFERDMIVERTQTGKAIAKQNPDFTEGRPYKFTEAQLKHAAELKKTMSYKQVTELTSVSESTLMRYIKRTEA